MPDLLFLYHGLILSVLLVLLGIVLVNLRVLPTLTGSSLPTTPDAAPTVAVLVPARNEEADIEACLRSLLAQDYPRMEVWLYDDASTDATPQIAARLVREDPRLYVVSGTGDPPPGWLGKANACHRLYNAMLEKSSPDYVLFTDADVRFEPSALRHAVATAQARGAGLLSVFPRQITITWAERLAVPVLQHWAVYSFLPLPLAFTKRTGPAFAAANGQFMLFRDDAYRAAGGHATVRANILEDVALARAVKRAGYRALLADGGPLVKTRMYRDAGEVWRGYSKNNYAFFGNSPYFLAVGVVVLTALYIAPPIFALYAAISHQLSIMSILPLAQYACAALSRLALAWRFDFRPLDAFLHPLAVVYMVAVGINSMVWSLTGRGAWKGRGTVGKSEGV